MSSTAGSRTRSSPGMLEGVDGARPGVGPEPDGVVARPPRRLGAMTHVADDVGLEASGVGERLTEEPVGIGDVPVGDALGAGGGLRP